MSVMLTIGLNESFVPTFKRSKPSSREPRDGSESVHGAFDPDSYKKPYRDITVVKYSLSSFPAKIEFIVSDERPRNHPNLQNIECS